MSNANLPKLEKNEQLRIARAKLKERGLSPTKLDKINRLKTLDLIYKWGYTSSNIVQNLLGVTKGGYLQKLAEQGYLKSARIEAVRADLPKAIYTLTSLGLEEAERHAHQHIRYIEINGFKQDKIRHNLLAQQVTINAMNEGVIDDYLSERMLATKDTSGKKRVDVAWSKADINIGVEIELSKKWERDLDDFVLKIITAIQSGKYNRFLIFSDSPAIISAYSSAMKAGENLRIWKKDQKLFWRVEKTETIPDWLLTKVLFQLL